MRFGKGNEQKLFKKRIADSWRKEFPFLKPVDLNEIPRVSKGCNFLCDAYGETRNRYYFVRLNFSAKRRGEFTIGITISSSAVKSILEHSLNTLELTPTSIGMFGIWKFLNQPNFKWALVNLEEEQNALFAKLGQTESLFDSNRSPHVWRPSSYDQPFQRIADEAINHVNLALRNHVFPLLHIAV